MPLRSAKADEAFDTFIEAVRTLKAEGISRTFLSDVVLSAYEAEDEIDGELVGAELEKDASRYYADFVEMWRTVPEEIQETPQSEQDQDVWYWHAKSNNGDLLFYSHGYNRKSDAEESARKATRENIEIRYLDDVAT